MLEYYFLFCNYFIVKVCCSCNVDCILKENTKTALSYLYTLYWWSIVVSKGSSHEGWEWGNTVLWVEPCVIWFAKLMHTYVYKCTIMYFYINSIVVTMFVLFIVWPVFSCANINVYMNKQTTWETFNSCKCCC